MSYTKKWPPVLGSRLLAATCLVLTTSLIIFVGSCSDISSGIIDNEVGDLSTQTSSAPQVTVGETTYQIIDLDPKGSYSFATGINENGYIVGTKGTSAINTAHMWRYDSPNGSIVTTDLGRLQEGNTAIAYDINENLQIVGSSDDDGVFSKAVFWESPSGPLSVIADFGGNEGFALGINQEGIITGYSTTTGSLFVFKGDKSNITVLADNPGINLGWDINNSETVVGAQSQQTTDYQAVKWDSDGNSFLLPGLSGTISAAQAINDKGEIVGFDGEFSPQVLRAFYIDENGNRIYIGDLGDANYSDAIGINNKSQVVGASKNEDGKLRAFIWDKENGMIDLGDLGGGSSQAWAINDKGQIVGSSETVSGETHAVLWNPISDSDTTPPELTYNISKTTLWPPNHKMRLAVSGITATDNVDPEPQVTISVMSNEPSNGTGDGNTEEDWNIVEENDGTYSLFLRAERNGNGEGRTYTIDITATDEAGNTAFEQVDVAVVHDQRML